MRHSKPQTLTPKDLRALIREELQNQNTIDWNLPAGKEIDDAVNNLTFAIIEYFRVDADSVDAYVPDVHNELTAAVEKIGQTFEWQP